MMILLEKVRQTAMSIAFTGTNPNPRASRKPHSDVNTIWPRPVARATGPTERIKPTSSLRPTTNSSTEMPMLESSLSSLPPEAHPNTAGPTTMPVRM